MQILSPNYSGFACYFLVITVLAVVLIALPYLLAPGELSLEKISAYECGFEPFTNPNEVFESHFIVVAILFLIFDLEIIFLLPWVAGGNLDGAITFWSILIFLIFLSLGLIYEWARGGLAWPIFFLFKKRNYFR